MAELFVDHLDEPGADPLRRGALARQRQFGFDAQFGVVRGLFVVEDFGFEGRGPLAGHDGEGGESHDEDAFQRFHVRRCF